MKAIRGWSSRRDDGANCLIRTNLVGEFLPENGASGWTGTAKPCESPEVQARAVKIRRRPEGTGAHATIETADTTWVGAGGACRAAAFVSFVSLSAHARLVVASGTGRKGRCRRW